MKRGSKLAILTLGSILMLGIAVATIPTVTAEDMAAPTLSTSHDESATLVAIDMKAHTLTMKDPKGEEHTAPFMGDAVKQMASFKAGDKVIVTCKDNAKGEHLGVSAIRAAKSQ